MALEKVLGGEESYQITSIRDASGDTKNATVITTHMGAIELVASRLKVGWVSCRTYIRTENEKCFRGQDMADGNARVQTGIYLCFNCGEQGHTIKDCRKASKCLDCNSQTHRTGSPELQQEE